MIVERPPTTARCCRCATAAPTCGWSSSSPTASTSPRSSACSPPARSPSSPTSSPTSRTRPATRCRPTKRERLLELARTHGFTIFEDDPYVALRFEGESLPTMLSMAGRDRRLRLVVLQDGLPGDPRRLPRRAGRADRPDRQDRHQHLHLAEHGGAGDRQPVLPLGRDRALDRDRPQRAARARRDALRGARSAAPRRPLRAPQGGYFLWVDLPRGTDVAALFEAAAARGVQFVKGPTSCSRAASRPCAWPTRA